MIENFYEILNKGWVPTVRKGSTGIGATFESLMGISENQKSEPDYKGIEIKTRRSSSVYFTTLFNLTPRSKEEYTIKMIREKYGYIDNNGDKVFNTNVFAHMRTPTLGKYSVRLLVDRESRIISLWVYYGKILIDSSIYWTFNDLKSKLYNKCYRVAFVEADHRMTHNVEHFKYKRIEIYRLKSFEKFLYMIERGYIRVAFKIGMFKNGNRAGLVHDHGTGFEIDKKYIDYLYIKEFDSKGLGTRG